MSYQYQTGVQGKEAYGLPRAIGNDRAIYEDFLNAQEKLRAKYAGAGSGNDNSMANYNAKSGFEKFKEQNYNPGVNRFNVFERQGTKEVPKTRDRFIHNPLS